MQESDSNWVYVVSLAKGVPKEWKISWIDIVEAKRRYLHAAQGGLIIGLYVVDTGADPGTAPQIGMVARAARVENWQDSRSTLLSYKVSCN
jgi:hypothetical protein